MDKKDIMYMAGAFCIILIVALVIKPVVTGHPVNIGIPVAPTPQPTLPLVTPDSGGMSMPVTTETTTPIPTPAPTPVPTWDATVKTVDFVDPSSYGISMNQSLPGGTKIDSYSREINMTTFATLSGQYSGTTQIMDIPFPYWEMWYTVEPAGAMGGKGMTVGSSTVTGPKQSGVKGIGSATVIQGSFSVTNPSFTLQVIDADDPNRIVRTITPPGGLDKDLWSGTSVTGDYSDTTTTVEDPRPWKEKFFEGQKRYYFIINAHSIESYTLELRIPSSYIGKY
jgi:hypothetical protein